jgi:group II intron reverse transcriptase/maturase
MTETLSSGDVYTKLQRIAEMARKHPERVFGSIHHVIDIGWLREAYHRTRKGGAVGVDGQTADEYATNLSDNLQSLLDRLKSGSYRAPPVRRVHIPKGDGHKSRPIGVPTFEDKVLQRAVTMVLTAIYEQDFMDGSYGFRPGRSAHDALEALRDELMSMGGGWVQEVDVVSFFDTLDHGHLRRFLDRRVTDGVIRRVIHKWLHAGVLEQGELSYPESGSPQGGVVSPMLANIYLHEVLDEWFEREVRPRLHGRGRLIRYGDDFVLIFEREKDARRVQRVLPKRFGKYGLSLHPDKTRLVRFERPSGPGGGQRGQRPESFALLGFTHYWAKSRRGYWVVKRRTESSRLSRALRRVWQWCKAHRHRSVSYQRYMLAAKLLGHYSYFGITSNGAALESFRNGVLRAWRSWLGRRGGRRVMSWARFTALLDHHPLPPVRVVHSVCRRPANP